MSNGISVAASVSCLAVSNFKSSKLRTSHCSSPSFVNSRPTLFSDLKLKELGFSRRNHRTQTQKWICNGSGDNESKTVLDAFFLGKAIGEALTERIETVVGEVLSTIGRVQSEQQKQVQDFQEEVLERAKRAKDRAAREAMEAQGLISRPVTIETTPVTSSTSDRVISVDQPILSAKENPSAAENRNPISKTSTED